MLRRTEAGWDLPPARPGPAGPRGPSFADCVRARLDEAPECVAVIEGPHRLTRAELVASAVRLGDALARRGLGRGAVVSVMLPNWAESCVVNLAASLFGFVVNPLLTMYRERELGFIFGQCRPAALFVPGLFRKMDYPALVRGAANAPGLILTVRGGAAGGDSFEALLDEPGPGALPPAVADEALKVVLYTSGSTGRPKGVLHSYGSVASTVRASGAFWGIDADDRMLVPSPVGHIGGSIYAFEFPWLFGASAVLMEAWDPTVAVDLIEREGATFCAGATPFLEGLLATALERRTRLPSLRRFICGGASVPVSLIERASAQFETAVIARAYGSTEVPLVCPGIRTRADLRAGATTDGEVTAELRLLDESGEATAPGRSGDVLARSPNMLVGYLDTADEEGALTQDGFFRMGDVGRLVEGRFLEITGRRKELIIRMGENISPREVENALVEHPAIAQTAIVGVPHERTGERAVAFVVLKPGQALTLAQMQDFLGEIGLAKPKFPEKLLVVEALPVNAIGKVMKDELRRLAIAAGA